jgi:hypothetical protein
MKVAFGEARRTKSVDESDRNSEEFGFLLCVGSGYTISEEFEFELMSSVHNFYYPASHSHNPTIIRFLRGNGLVSFLKELGHLKYNPEILNDFL